MLCYNLTIPFQKLTPAVHRRALTTVNAKLRTALQYAFIQSVSSILIVHETRPVSPRNAGILASVPVESTRFVRQSITSLFARVRLVSLATLGSSAPSRRLKNRPRNVPKILNVQTIRPVTIRNASILAPLIPAAITVGATCNCTGLYASATKVSLAILNSTVASVRLTK